MGTLAEEIGRSLFHLGCVKFGEFTLKSGASSPIYIDLRLLVSSPEVLRDVARAMWRFAKDRQISFDRFGAVPVAGLPIGVALALETGLPMIYPREIKQHGTKQAIEGIYETGETILVVDDLITRGDSKFEAIAVLEEAGLVVKDVLVLIDRGQGGGADLARRGYKLHACLLLKEILSILWASNLITSKQHEEVLSYLDQK